MQSLVPGAKQKNRRKQPRPLKEQGNSADDIRKSGWMVAVHNDYRLKGERYTFWLFTKGDRAIKGEGKTDEEALNQVRDKIKKKKHQR